MAEFDATLRSPDTKRPHPRTRATEAFTTSATDCADKPCSALLSWRVTVLNTNPSVFSAVSSQRIKAPSRNSPAVGKKTFTPREPDLSDRCASVQTSTPKVWVPPLPRTLLNHTMQLRPKLFVYLLLWHALALPISLHAQQHRQQLSGVVQRVIDGDTLVLWDATQTKRTLRLAGIDAPESRMPYGQQAKAYLAELVLGYEVVAITGKQDRYGRSIATLKVDGNDVNLAMIQAGLAWHYTKYAKEQPIEEAARYAAAQQSARAQGLGLWRDECALAPWAWRQGRKSTPVKITNAITTWICSCL